MAVCLCLGFYLVTRTPRSRLSWLAALLLWSLTGFYLHNTMAIHVPGSGMLPWLRLADMLALPFGFHLVCSCRPARSRHGLTFTCPRSGCPMRCSGGWGMQPGSGATGLRFVSGPDYRRAFPFPMGVLRGSHRPGPLPLRPVERLALPSLDRLPVALGPSRYAASLARAEACP